MSVDQSYQGYSAAASMLFIDPAMASSYVSSLGRDRFDRAVGKMLLDADLAAVDMPRELGDIFRERVRAHLLLWG